MDISDFFYKVQGEVLNKSAENCHFNKIFKVSFWSSQLHTYQQSWILSKSSEMRGAGVFKWINNLWKKDNTWKNCHTLQQSVWGVWLSKQLTQLCKCKLFLDSIYISQKKKKKSLFCPMTLNSRWVLLKDSFIKRA